LQFKPTSIRFSSKAKDKQVVKKILTPIINSYNSATTSLDKKPQAAVGDTSSTCSTSSSTEEVSFYSGSKVSFSTRKILSGF
jgi:hypothetical protein